MFVTYNMRLLRCFPTIAPQTKLPPKIDFTPPVGIPPAGDTPMFSIKVTTFEQTNGDRTYKRFVGYSQDSEIIPKTMELCNKIKKNGSFCTRPIITTAANNIFTECVVVDNYVKETTTIHYV